MNDIEKRARELLAAEYERFNLPSTAEGIREGSYDLNPSMLALVAALTPPDGFVLMPVVPTVEVLTAMSLAIGMEPLPPLGNKKGFYPITGSQSTVRQCYAALIAARPEVSP